MKNKQKRKMCKSSNINREREKKKDSKKKKWSIYWWLSIKSIFTDASPWSNGEQANLTNQFTNVASSNFSECFTIANWKWYAYMNTHIFSFINIFSFKLLMNSLFYIPIYLLFLCLSNILRYRYIFIYTHLYMLLLIAGLSKSL